MIKPTPHPKLKHPRLLFVPYALALALIALVVVQLVGFGGLSFGDFSYTTPGSPAWIIFVALVEIFALPFILRLRLSPLARFFSALFTVLAPVLLFGDSLVTLATGTTSYGTTAVWQNFGLVMLGVGSFVILSGTEALKLKAPPTNRSSAKK